MVFAKVKQSQFLAHCIFTKQIDNLFQKYLHADMLQLTLKWNIAFVAENVFMSKIKVQMMIFSFLFEMVFTMKTTYQTFIVVIYQ